MEKNTYEMSGAMRERLLDVMAQLDRETAGGKNVNVMSNTTRERLLEWKNWIETKQKVKK